MQNNAVWFVTGASRGFGLTLVKQLLARGHRVAATSRTPVELTAAIGEMPDRFLPLAMNLGDDASIEQAVAATVAHFGRLDVVVNNAGYGQLGAVEEVTAEEVRRNFEVNVFGTLAVLRATLPHLRARRAGHVFNISSIAGLVGAFSGWGVYCATKFAVSGLTESLHADLEPLGIGVTLVYPGYFRTDFLSPGSVGRPARPIADYAAARASEQQHLTAIAGNQPGDPDKAMAALIDAYERGDAPLHLLLGSDAVQLADAKVAEVGRAIAAHRAISVGTDR